MINQGHYHWLPDVYSREAPNIRMASDGRLLLPVANNQISCNPTSTNQALAFKIFAVIPKAQIGSIALKLHCNHCKSTNQALAFEIFNSLEIVGSNISCF